MALDLIERKFLAGKAMHEVATLLGPPESSNSGAWVYSVGQCGFGWGHNELAVTFDANAKVAHAVFN